MSITGTTIEHFEYIVPEPPSDLYPYLDKTSEILAEGTVTCILEKIVYEDGIFVYKKGAKYPEKGYPTAEAIWSINFAKRAFVESLKLFKNKLIIPSIILFLFISKKRKIEFIEKLLTSFNSVVFRCVKPYILHHSFLTPISRELYLLIKSFLSKLEISAKVADEFAEIIAHCIQYDDAYRYRIEDILSETTKEQMLEDPSTEIDRLLLIMDQRDGKDVFVKFERAGEFLFFLLKVPFIRKAFEEVIRDSKFENLQYDEADKYWVCMRDGYNFRGMTFAERQKMLRDNGDPIPNLYQITYNPKK